MIASFKVMEMKNLFGLVFLFGGLVIFLSSKVSITGAYIGAQTGGSILGIFLIMISGFVFLTGKSKLEDVVIDGVKYEGHVLERMRQRKLLPSVVKHVLEHGDHYKLKHVKNYDETKGATDVYVGRHIADIAPGKGGIGERIIKVQPGKREWKNVLVLAKGNKVVKTVYSCDDKELSEFIRRYL